MWMAYTVFRPPALAALNKMGAIMLFHYEKTRKRQAVSVGINILLLPLLLYAFQFVAKDEANFEQMFAIAELAVLAVAVVLAAVFVWLLTSKEKFEIYVTENEFYSAHPTFKEWCFSVNPKDIKSIDHKLNIDSTAMTNINVHLNNGRKLQICQNYSFSRKDLYAALISANPKIKLPDNANVFKH